MNTEPSHSPDEPVLLTIEDRAWLANMDRAFGHDQLIALNEQLNQSAIRWCKEAQEYAELADALRAENDALRQHVEKLRQRAVQQEERIERETCHGERSQSALVRASFLAGLGWVLLLGTLGFYLTKGI